VDVGPNCYNTNWGICEDNDENLLRITRGLRDIFSLFILLRTEDGLLVCVLFFFFLSGLRFGMLEFMVLCTFLLFFRSVCFLLSRMVRFGFGNGAVLFMGSSFIML
jgi:hypothetical protein